MKSKVLTALLICIVSLAGAQNYMDYSRKEIEGALSEKGDSYLYKQTDDGTLYLYSSNRVLDTYKFYYFDDNNKCYLYVLILADASYSDLVDMLDRNYIRTENKWYDSNSEAKLEYDSEIKAYIIKFARK